MRSNAQLSEVEGVAEGVRSSNEGSEIEIVCRHAQIMAGDLASNSKMGANSAAKHRLNGSLSKSFNTALSQSRLSQQASHDDRIPRSTPQAIH